MSIFKTWCRFLCGWRFWVFAVVVYICLFSVVRVIVPAPKAVGISGERQISRYVQFIYDNSWIDTGGQRQLSQNIFDALIQSIEQAREFIVLDMFLFNAWQGPTPELHRALSEELTHALIKQRSAHPDMLILVISDPINTVYNGLASEHFEALKSAGISVVMTDLVKLQDSNPLWSSLWRWAIRPLGNAPGTLLPNPFGDGRVSVRSYLALLNFKANHRKLLVADSGNGEVKGWVSSANPHDGSSAHRNVAIQFDGEAVWDLINSERALLLMSGADAELEALDIALADFRAGAGSAEGKTSVSPTESTPLTVQVLSESRIHEAILNAINKADDQASIDIAMFYISERQIIKALKAASQRGVSVRLLLDVNSDAFGRQKNGVPNRPVAAELHKAGVSVRWCATQGEQCHAKWLHVASAEEHTFILGSANYTRRNLLDLNLETNVSVVAAADHPLLAKMADFFDQQWNNEAGKTYSTDYEKFAEDSLWLTLQYRFMEYTGLSTF